LFSQWLTISRSIEAIALFQPRTVSFGQLRTAMADGLAALATVPQLSGEFLLKGVSGIARRDWGRALSNLWITIEQLTGFLWEREVLANLPEGAERIDASGTSSRTHARGRQQPARKCCNTRVLSHLRRCALSIGRGKPGMN
jgi:hypothetical protein